MPLPHIPPLIRSAGRPNRFGQIGGQRHRREMGARGMAADIEAVGVAAEARRVAVDPGDRTADLIGHRKQAAIGILDPDKIGHDVMRAGADEHLGRRRIGLGQTRPPRAAMDEDKDRGGVAVGTEDVQLLDRARAIGQPQRRADAGAGPLAVAGPTVPQLLDVRLIGGLVVGGVELRLGVVQKNQRLVRFASRSAH
jgi:hypothetical protein